MSAPMKRHPIKDDPSSSILYVEDGQNTYAIPVSVAKVYKIKPRKAVHKQGNVSSEDVFKELREESSKASSLLRGLRYRENLSQVEFAKKIKVTQANLSKMECGHRPIGKTIAKRIEKVFGTHYKYFLE